MRGYKSIFELRFSGAAQSGRERRISFAAARRHAEGPGVLQLFRKLASRLAALAHLPGSS